MRNVVNARDDLRKRIVKRLHVYCTGPGGVLYPDEVDAVTDHVMAEVVSYLSEADVEERKENEC